MISEAERRELMAKRGPMTKDDLDRARVVMCDYVEPETSVAYYFTLLLLEAERVQAVAASPRPAAPDLARIEQLVDVLMASVELDGFHGDEEDEPAVCRAALLAAIGEIADPERIAQLQRIADGNAASALSCLARAESAERALGEARRAAFEEAANVTLTRADDFGEGATWHTLVTLAERIRALAASSPGTATEAGRYCVCGHAESAHAVLHGYQGARHPACLILGGPSGGCGCDGFAAAPESPGSADDGTGTEGVGP